MSNDVRDNSKLHRFELDTDGHIAFSEYRHYVVRVEWDSPADRLDDDSGERCRYRGLLLFHCKIWLDPFLG